ncbi:MAG TPA: polysaccharide pyruvyl transferase family protein [Candidatus Brachybacterium merdigallinarum]|nr:polysaccharide pyruvyl transferase family protein [Candidatus Brachybacterium merdigallinarum]
MKIALLCDVDQTVYHVGDEAIATATAQHLTRLGHQVLRISRREKYGPGEAERTAPEATLPALTFPWPLPERAAYLEEVRRVLGGWRQALPPQDKLFDIIERFRDIDALVIGGGGSLTSRFGWLLDERLATALVARSLGKPVVLSGQSLGPELTDADRESVAELMGLCSVVGLRDAASAERARQLCPDHPAIVHTLDDAVGLEVLTALPAPDPGLISVTLGGDGDPLPREDYVEVAAAVIDALATRTGARVEFVPHMADPEEGGSDEALHAEVAARLSVPSLLRRIELASDSAARTAGAGWVVSTRFHPVVFGTLAGASVLALPLNRYGASRMDGALRAVGIERGGVPLAALWDPRRRGASPLLEQVVDELVASREAEIARLAAARPIVQEASRSWWETISGALTSAGRTTQGTSGRPVIEDPHGAGIDPSPRWSTALTAQLAPWTRPTPASHLDSVPHTTSAPQPEPAPRAAIIMRTRDRLRMLDRAIQDVLSQTRHDWELVIVDDAGDAAAVDEVVARHHTEAAGRISVIHREESRGMEAASNAGLAATSAPFVAVHDDDDTWHATFLQETLAHLEAEPQQEAVVVRTLIVLEHETATGFVEDEVFPSWPELAGVRLLDYLAVNRNVPIAMLHRRRVHEEVGQYDEALPVVGDYAFHLALLQRFEVGFLDRPLAQWRQRPSATGAAGNSMVTQSHGHRHYDGVLREQHLREWTREHGIGLPLFISHDTRTHVTRSEERLLEELREIREELTETRHELARVRSRLEQVHPAVLAGRAVRLAQRAGRRAAREGRRHLPGRSE